MQNRRWKYDIKINPMKVFSDDIDGDDARQCRGLCNGNDELRKETRVLNH